MPNFGPERSNDNDSPTNSPEESRQLRLDQAKEDAKNTIASCLEKLSSGDKAAALELVKTKLGEVDRILTYTDRELVDCKITFAKCLAANARLDEAQDYFAQWRIEASQEYFTAYNIACITFDEEHADILNLYGQNQEASRLYERVSVSQYLALSNELIDYYIKDQQLEKARALCQQNIKFLSQNPKNDQRIESKEIVDNLKALAAYLHKAERRGLAASIDGNIEEITKEYPFGLTNTTINDEYGNQCELADLNYKLAKSYADPADSKVTSALANAIFIATNLEPANHERSAIYCYVMAKTFVQQAKTNLAIQFYESSIAHQSRSHHESPLAQAAQTSEFGLLLCKTSDAEGYNTGLRLTQDALRIFDPDLANADESALKVRFQLLKNSLTVITQLPNKNKETLAQLEEIITVSRMLGWSSVAVAFCAELGFRLKVSNIKRNVDYTKMASEALGEITGDDYLNHVKSLISATHALEDRSNGQFDSARTKAKTAITQSIENNIPAIIKTKVIASSLEIISTYTTEKPKDLENFLTDAAVFAKKIREKLGGEELSHLREQITTKLEELSSKREYFQRCLLGFIALEIFGEANLAVPTSASVARSLRASGAHKYAAEIYEKLARPNEYDRDFDKEKAFAFKLQAVRCYLACDLQKADQILSADINRPAHLEPVQLLLKAIYSFKKADWGNAYDQLTQAINKFEECFFDLSFDDSIAIKDFNRNDAASLFRSILREYGTEMKNFSQSTTNRQLKFKAVIEDFEYFLKGGKKILLPFDRLKRLIRDFF